LETIPSPASYLSAPPQKVTDWGSRLGAKNRRRVGIIWSGNPAHKRDQNRSVGLDALLPILDSDVTFVSLQKDVRAGDATVLEQHNDILQFSDSLVDFSETAALMAQLDLIISVDTSTAHLAGALGRPVWILLPYLPDWRWLLDRNTSPWYPTARLFRQDQTRAWDGVVRRLRAALLQFADGE